MFKKNGFDNSIFLLFSFMFLLDVNVLSAQQSFEVIIDEENLYEIGTRVIEVSNNRYVADISREIENANSYNRRYSFLALIGETGDVLSVDSIMLNDTVTTHRFLLPFGENGLLSFGSYGKFNSDFEFEFLGSQVSLFDLSNDQFELLYIKKYQLNYNDDMFSWKTQPVINTGTDSCFIVWSSSYYGNHKLFCLNPLTGDSLFTKDIYVPNNWGIRGVHFSSTDTSILLHYTIGSYTEYSNIVMRLDHQYALFSDTLMSVNTNLTSLYPKVLTHPNGNIYIAGEAKWTDWTTLEQFKYFGVFSYSNNFYPLEGIYLTHPDTTSQTAFIETADIAADGSIYIASNYNFHGHPFSGAKTKIYLARLDENLDLIWEKYIGGDRYYVVNSIAATSDLGAIISGYGFDINYPETNGFAWFVKYKPDGTVGFEREISNGSSLDVYPNPVFSNLVVRTMKKGVVQIFNDIGQLKLTTQIKENDICNLDLSNLSSGHYVVMLISEDNIQMKKIIKF